MTDEIQDSIGIFRGAEAEEKNSFAQLLRRSQVVKERECHLNLFTHVIVLAVMN